MGITTFFTPAGYGTEIANGKEARQFKGKMYLMENALHADFALVTAWKGDNFNWYSLCRKTKGLNPLQIKAFYKKNAVGVGIEPTRGS